MRLIVLCLLLLTLTGCSSEEPSSLSVSNLLSNPNRDGYEKATTVKTFSFPEDHGAHPGYGTEWWYLTGNLQADNGKRFGYQFTLFRYSISPSQPTGHSPWRASDIYMGHLAVSDIDAQQHLHDEKFARGSVGLAGVKIKPFSAWIGSWRLDGTESLFPLQLKADSDDFQIDLTINAGIKHVVLQGDQGLSQKSAKPGNASYYYSFTRLPTQGSLNLQGQRFDVTGNSWLDREWSTSALDKEQVGWDWFSLQLEDGQDLMFYRLRTEQQQMHPFSRGSLVNTKGNKTDIKPDAVELMPTQWWNSEKGERFPIAWNMKLPEHQIDIQITATIPDQLMRTSVRYWEGAVTVKGSHKGVGYMELSGYTDKN